MVKIKLIARESLTDGRVSVSLEPLISRGTDKEDELFDYANIPSYMKSNKNTYNEKDKDDFELER